LTYRSFAFVFCRLLSFRFNKDRKKLRGCAVVRRNLQLIYILAVERLMYTNTKTIDTLRDQLHFGILCVGRANHVT